MIRHLGYACINMELSSKKDKVTTNRSMIKKTFKAKGLDYASDLALMNCKDLKKILEWNLENDFMFFRISSEMFPWASEYELESLKDFDEIKETLRDCGDFANKNNMRLSFHPGPFNKLCSSDDRIVSNTISNLEHHSEVFDLMNLSQSFFNKINIHVGGAYGDREKTAKVFCKNFCKLSDSLKSRLTVENDDRESLYSTEDLYHMVYKKIKVPIVHDIHHHKFRPGSLSQKEAMDMACSTWGDVVPVLHYSESRKDEHGGKVKENAHSDYIYNKIEVFENNVDVMVEAKMKEKTVQRYLEKFSK